jgi:predicted ester cyclase
MTAVASANKQAIEGFIQAVWREGRLDQLPEFWTSDCVNHAAPEGQNRGLGALRAYHEGFLAAFQAFSGPEIRVVQQIEEGDRVVTHIVTTATHTGSFAGIPPTGRRVSLATIRIDRLAASKIAEHWSIADMAGLFEQLK